MHESPQQGQLRGVTNPNPTRPAFPRQHSPKVLAVVAAWLCLASTCIFPVLAASTVTQEKHAEAEAKPEPAYQPAAPNTPALDLSDEVVRDVLINLQRGIETHELERVMEIFDPQNMKDYAQFHDQMAAFFRRYDSVRFRYQLMQVTSDKDLGFAIADIEMDADPSDILPAEQRRSTQMRFQLKRGPKGWKVIGLRPADFFNQ